ncbi:putative porin [Jiulongibacter sp. NS-SX5]|uniref:putative porin n=1 Tax=Jiulongibacter sp. NS-SX5 TaxID=3463854 RepID=UPI0040585E0D
MGKKLSVILLLLSFHVSAQKILNDTLQNVYGPSSVGFLFQSDVVLDDTLLRHPDTLLGDFRLMTLNHQNGLLWQDLGNEGTAAKSMVFQLPENSFTETGFNAFAPFYAPKVEEVRYYNTRSPFTNMAYTQSGNGMSNLGLTHSQNISPCLNATLDVRRMLSSKQWSSSTSEDRLVDHWDYTLSSNYISENSKYRFLGAFLHMNHAQLEQGGISAYDGQAFIPESELNADYNTNYQERLNGIRSRERWNDLHIYHQYQLSKAFQVFHELDYQRHKYFYRDTLLSTNELTGIYTAVDSNANNKMKNYYFFNNLQNRVGVKGYFKGFKYNIGLTSRFYSFNAVHEGESGNTRTEILVGGTAGYWFPDSLSYLENELYLGIGNYANVYLRSALKIKNFDLGFQYMLKPPYLLFNQFSSPVAAWQNDYKALSLIRGQGSFLLKGRRAFLKPEIKVNLIDNHLFFDELREPQQLENQALITEIGLSVGVGLGNWNLRNRLIYNAIGNKDVFRLPALINNFNLEYHFTYAKTLEIYLGTDVYFRSKYLGDAYSPYLQSFYLQNEQEVWGQPIADVYTNFMIKRVKLAFSFNYVNQGIPTQGFYTTPKYLAMSRTFHLKVNWPLFD